MGLFDFGVGLLLLLATGFVFFLVIDRIATDATLNKIAKVGVGVVLLVVFIFALRAVLFGGGGGLHLDPHGFLYFCIGVIVILVVLYIVELVLGWIAGAMGVGAPIVEAVRYVIFAVALIAMLVLADKALLGGGFTSALGDFSAGRISR